MIFEADVTINGSRTAVWAAIADVEHAAESMSGIESIEVVQKPASGLVGLRWKETRLLFDKPATVEKWVTEAAENEFYRTRAESDGFVFLTTLRLSQGNGGITLTSTHESQPQTLVAKLMTIPMRFLFKGVALKAIRQDLDDIKAAVERGRAPMAPGLQDAQPHS